MKILRNVMPEAQYLTLSDVTLAYYEVGANPTGSDGVPVVFLHGFPGLAYSWRHQLKAFEEAGIWAIALEQRGYGLSSAPKEIEAYDMKHLTDDLVGLLKHLGVQKAIWCGHDWGGFIVWQMVLMHKEKTAGVISLNLPFMQRPPVDPIAIMRARMGDEMYIVHFQKPGEADSALGANVSNTFNFFMRKPIGIDNPSEGFATVRTEETSVFPLVRMLEAYDPLVDTHEKFLTDAEFDFFVRTFERTGFTGAINWYRNMTRNWEASAELPSRIDDIPCLMITAELDPVLPPSAAAHMPKLINDLETVLIKGSGHWTQEEKPKDVNQILLDWLGRRFFKEAKNER